MPGKVRIQKQANCHESPSFDPISNKNFIHFPMKSTYPENQLPGIEYTRKITCPEHSTYPEKLIPGESTDLKTVQLP
jgi:hypothetical protein